MARPPGGALLELVDAGRGSPPAVRALLLLPPEAEAWSVGERDRALMRTRARWFGARWDLEARCPACAAPLDLPVDVAAMGADPAAQPSEGGIEVDEGPLRWRAPTAGELARISLAADVRAAERLLLDVCVEGVDPHRLAPEVRARVMEGIAAADPDAVTLLGLACPDCGHDWEEPLDVPGALWREVEHCVDLLLEDVGALAGRYGWTEGDVLALPDWRRRWYVERLER